MTATNDLHDQAEVARKVFAGDCTFVLGVADYHSLPAGDIPEIAFAGRSNVGKSSLLNALVNRKSLARASNTPGRTQQINFFKLGDDKLHLADLPGYGYAVASKKEVAGWNKLIRDYLKKRPQLRRVYVLVDSRHGLKPVDHEIMDLLDEAAVSYAVLLTKIDKIKSADLPAVQQAVEKELVKRKGAFPQAHPTSSEKKIGFEELRTSIAQMLNWR